MLMSRTNKKKSLRNFSLNMLAFKKKVDPKVCPMEKMKVREPNKRWCYHVLRGDGFDPLTAHKQSRKVSIASFTAFFINIISPYKNTRTLKNS